MSLARKRAALAGRLEPLGSALVAFSGGVDSAVLLRAALDDVRGRVLAATAVSPLHPLSAKAVAIGRRLGAEVREVAFDPLDDARFCANPPERCYLCKRGMLAALAALAREEGLEAVLEGSVTDDLWEHRPGRRAVAELGARSPLVEAGLSKADVRALARSFDLEVAARPSEPCLATRVPYGRPLGADLLERIARAEAAVRDRVGGGPVRVRAHGRVARIEVAPDRIERLVAPDARRELQREIRALGFAYVAADLAGYRSGALDEVLDEADRRAAAEEE